MRVLIVEDDPLIAMMIEDTLGDAGHEVLGTTTSSHEAMSVVAEMRPDLMLLDVTLQDGETGCKLASEAHEKWKVPTIFVTGSPEKALRCDNALGVLAKPFHPDSVSAAVDIASSLRAGERPAYVPAELQLF